MNLNQVDIDNSFKWLVIAILMSVGNPDIIDKIIQVLDSLSKYLLK